MFFSCDDMDLELLGVFKIKREAAAPKASIKRNYDSISIRTSGSGVFRAGVNQFTVRRGDVLYLPYAYNYTHQTEGETVYALHFITKTSHPFSQSERICCEDSELVEQIIRQMYDVWKEQQQGYRYKCTSLLYDLIYLLNRHSHHLKTIGAGTESCIAAAVEYIHKNYRRESIDIGSLAQLCSVSETYFRKTFKEAYGVAPKSYVINLKLDFAAKLLESRLYTVSEVAERAGFNDTKYFSKLFKKQFGLPPAQYQKKGYLWPST